MKIHLKKYNGTILSLAKKPIQSSVNTTQYDHYVCSDGCVFLFEPNGNFYVRFSDDDIGKSILRKMLNECELVKEYSRLEYVFRDKDGKSMETCLKMQDSNGIVSIEPEIVTEPQYFSDGNQYFNQWHLQDIKQTQYADESMFVQSADASVGAVGAWRHFGFLDTSTNVDLKQVLAKDKGFFDRTVCVVDDGFDVEHPDLKDAVFDYYDAFTNEKYPQLQAGQQHGTPCASLLAGLGRYCYGVAPKANMSLVRMNFISDTVIERIINNAIEQKVEVMSCSWGAASSNWVLSSRIEAALRKGRENGISIFFAAGNQNKLVKRGTFAADPNVVCVGAYGSSDLEKTEYSNYGPHIDIVGPSSSGEGASIVASDVRQLSQYVYGYNQNGNYTTTFGGTSAACPIVAGLAVIALQENTLLTPKEIKYLLIKSASNTDRRTDDLGYGRVWAQSLLNEIKNFDGLPKYPQVPGSIEMRMQEHRILSFDIADSSTSINSRSYLTTGKYRVSLLDNLGFSKPQKDFDLHIGYEKLPEVYDTWSTMDSEKRNEHQIINIENDGWYYFWIMPKEGSSGKGYLVIRSV